MSGYRESEALRALGGIDDVLGGRDVVSAGRLSALDFKDGILRVTYALPPETTQQQGLALQQATERALDGLAGVERLAVLLTTHRAAPKLQAKSRKQDRNPHPNKRPDGYQGDARVRHIVAVSSAKGGVGKSTVTVGTARALAAQGLKVGVLDADVHGPSLPSLLGVSGQLGTREVEGRRLIAPAESDGVKAVSIGLLTGNSDPVVWRGPMVQGAIARMLWDTDWGGLDVLLIDMPPGTGDPQLGLAQDIKPSPAFRGAVVVTTPQDLALLDARKGVGMFAAVDIPVLGWVENMASFTCPDCGSTHALFGDGDPGLSVPKLASLPLSLQMRGAREGYDDLAYALLERLG